jgi:hypothetical protein
MEENKFGKDQSQYERPNHSYRCGRAMLWQTPCNRGPETDGACGGTRECTPFLKNDQWECRRDKIFGGPCDEGPNQNGECCIQRPACAPHSSLRVIRSRATLLVLLAVIALIIGSLGLGSHVDGLVSISDAGPLLKSHIKFTEKQGCNACHQVHGQGITGWVKAVFRPSNLSDQCVNCHSFGGDSTAAHNDNMLTDREVSKTQCVMCHREHSGISKVTRTLSSKQCNSCHKNKFESFVNGHPEFSKKYPYFSRDSIKYDHGSHLNKHFSNPKFSDKAPISCVNCHTITLSNREIKPGNYETTCANCHNNQIKKKELIVIRLPELLQNRIDGSKLIEACDFPETKMEVEEEFLSVSTEQPALVSAFLMNFSKDDPESYGKPLQDLIVSMAEESTVSFAKLIDNQTPTPISENLLAGLNPEVLKRAACAWGLNREYEPPAETKYGGWYADMLEIRYKPSGHADPVAKSWIEFALAVSTEQDEDGSGSRAIAMREQILSIKDGVGGCIKCHAITEDKNAKGDSYLAVDWNYQKKEESPYVRYKHDDHVDIMGESSCSNCHIINKEEGYMSSFKEYDSTDWINNFKPIKKETCMQCHSEDQIDMECQTCHLYHLKPSFKKDMVAVKADPIPIRP